MKGSNQFLNGGYWIITKGIQDMKVLRDGKSHCNCYADIDYIRYIGNFCKASHLLIGPNSMKARHTACFLRILRQTEWEKPASEADGN